jgi:hypothetical protein
MACTGVRLVVAATAIAVLAGCQTITEESPTSPTKVTMSPLAIPVLGVPTPAPTSSPTPSPSPTPQPTPQPTPPPGSSCSLPASNPANPQCTDETPLLFGAVDTALTTVTQQNPGLFDFDNKKCDNCYYVKDVSGYIAAVGKQLAKQGLCMIGDAEEIGVKKVNDYSEQYDILLASQHMRRGLGSYRGICRPALF